MQNEIIKTLLKLLKTNDSSTPLIARLSSEIIGIAKVAHHIETGEPGANLKFSVLTSKSITRKEISA